ncbi:envelope glycoprotein H [Murid herpesvirus 3]|uniref:Envelope glycoprotein H n=2 Tax=Murid betaherpesvirus 3 TaxID=2560603 RepID=A0A1P8VIW9_9BETA|nr:envelope glycoprotein H [Murine roseolovirus]APZ76277.1 envelope glycoprotein H [Murid betaherpesvirus 3]AYH64721.1 envelope glycoprotein H [Murid herpesvirus 3]
MYFLILIFLTIRFHYISYAQEEKISCVNGDVTTIDQKKNKLNESGLITIYTQSMKDSKLYTEVFQFPKCIFATDRSQHYFDEISFNLSNTIYQNIINNYYLKKQNDLSIHSSGNKQQIYGSYSTTNIGLDILKNENTYYLNTTVHRSKYNDTCVFFPDFKNVVFLFKKECEEIIIKTPYANMSFQFTDSFFSYNIKLNNVECDFDENVTIFFGNSKLLHFKSPFRKPDFVYMQTINHDFVIISRLDTALLIPEINTFIKDLLQIEYINTRLLYEYFNKNAISLILSNKCAAWGPEWHRLLFSYGLMLQIYNGLYDTNIKKIDLAFNDHIYILIMKSVLENCLHAKMTQQIKFLYHEIDAFLQINADKIYFLKSNYFHNSDQILLALTLFNKTEDNKIPTWSKNILLKVVSNLKTKYSLGSPINPEDRITFFLLYEFIRKYTGTHFTEIRTLFVTACSLDEITLWANNSIHHENNFINIFSPCIISRRDISKELLAKIFLSNTDSTVSNNIINIINTFKLPYTYTKQSLSCISYITQTIPLELKDITYILSNTYVLQGTNYPITTTSVKTNIILTSVKDTSMCRVTNYKYKETELVHFKNITVESKCTICDSYLVIYDDIVGVLHVLYIQTTETLLEYLDPDNEKLIDSPRIHYLLLLNNGTAGQITPFKSRFGQGSIVMIFVYIIIITIIILIVYRVVKLL